MNRQDAKKDKETDTQMNLYRVFVVFSVVLVFLASWRFIPFRLQGALYWAGGVSEDDGDRG
jgi:hypothetical protein